MKTTLIGLIAAIFISISTITQAAPPVPWAQTDNMAPHTEAEIYSEFSKDNLTMHEIIKFYGATFDRLKSGPINLPPWSDKYLNIQQLNTANLLTHLKNLQVPDAYLNDKQNVIDACISLQSAINDMQTYIDSKNTDKDIYEQSAQEIKQAIQLKKDAWAKIETDLQTNGYKIPAK